MIEPSHPMSRRVVLGAGLLLLAPELARGALPPARRLAFAISRNGAHIGEHLMTFAGDAGAPVVTTEVSMVVRLGPVPVYRYRHHATERWSAGRFQSLETATDSNGKPQTVSAHRGDGGLVIESAKGRVVGPANAVPFTHWNSDAFADPLFNPQEGKMLKVQVSKAGAGHWAVRGEAEIDDYYDADGVWRALKGRLKDGSAIEYRST
jgi:hypothetical protein